MTGETLYHVSAAPHVREDSSTREIMTDVCIAMLPAAAFGVYQFGLRALAVLVATVAACVLAEYLFQKGMKKPLTVKDFSAVVTGLILALNMPVNIPLWMPVLGGFFAIIVVKQLYGGIGQNWMNPALAARCFLLISFAGKMTDFSSAALGFDSLSGATPLAALKAGEFFSSYKTIDLLFGTHPGTIGEVSAVALLMGAGYLLVKKIITWHIPLAYILSFALFVFCFGKPDLSYVAVHLLGGGLIFGAFFMATDYSSSPVTRQGQIVFGVFLGVLTGIFRLFGESAEGVSYAVLMGNIVAPLIERVTLPVAFGRRRKPA